MAKAPEVRVLLTGEVGFIGSYVAEHLIQSGHELAVVDRQARERPQRTKFYEAEIFRDFEHFDAEVSTSSEQSASYKMY